MRLVLQYFAEASTTTAPPTRNPSWKPPPTYNQGKSKTQALVHQAKLALNIKDNEQFKAIKNAMLHEGK